VRYPDPSAPPTIPERITSDSVRLRLFDKFVTNPALIPVEYIEREIFVFTTKITDFVDEFPTNPDELSD